MMVQDSAALMALRPLLRTTLSTRLRANDAARSRQTRYSHKTAPGEFGHPLPGPTTFDVIGIRPTPLNPESQGQHYGDTWFTCNLGIAFSNVAPVTSARHHLSIGICFRCVCDSLSPPTIDNNSLGSCVYTPAGAGKAHSQASAGV